MQLAGARVAGERVAHARRVIRRIATNADRIQAARLPRHAVGGGAVRRRHRPTRDAMHGRSLALRGGGRVQFAPDLGAFLVDLVHGFVDVPIVLQRVRHQFGEPPWPAGQEILGGGPFRHHRDVRQAFRAVLQCDEMPMDRDTLDAQAVRALQEWRDCKDSNTGCRSAWRKRPAPRRRRARSRKAIRPPRARLRPAGMEARASAYRSHRSRNSDSTRCGTPRRAEYPRHAPPRLRSRRSSHRIPRRFRAE